MERGYAITGHRLNPTYSLTKIDVGPRHRAGRVRPRPARRAGQGLPRRAADRRARHRSVRRVAAPTPTTSGRQWSAELLDAAGLDSGLLPQIVAVHHGGRSHHRGGGRRDRASRRHARRDRRRRRPVGGARRGHHRAPSPAPTRTSAHRRGCRSPRRAPARSRDAHDDVQPRDPRPVRPDRHHAGGRRVARVDHRRARAERRGALRTAAAAPRPTGGGGRAALPAPPARRALAVLEPEGPRGVRRAAHATTAGAASPAPCWRGWHSTSSSGLRAFTENGAAVDAVDAIGGAANSDLLLGSSPTSGVCRSRRRMLVDEATSSERPSSVAWESASSPTSRSPPTCRTGARRRWSTRRGTRYSARDMSSSSTPTARLEPGSRRSGDGECDPGRSERSLVRTVGGDVEPGALGS